jgi:WS/DGAT C-terminal domain
LLVQRLKLEIGVQGRRADAGFAGERDADRRHPELREVEAEQVRVVLVVGVQRKAAVERAAGVPGPASCERDHRRRARPAAAGLPGRARLLEVFPVLPLIAKVTLGVGALSYAGQFNITVVADRDAVPDLEIFAEPAQNELRALRNG